MKTKFYLITLLTISILMSCSSDDDNQTPPAATSSNIQLSFTHFWDGTPVTNQDFNNTQYTNANGDELNIERLRYLISRVTLTNVNSETIVLDGYNLVDLNTNSNLTFSPTEDIPNGEYQLTFTFGFNNKDNIDGVYADLNSANFNVPMMLGGGYHYMQFDGKYVDNLNPEAPFNYHAIRAVDNPGANPTFPKDTFFIVNLGDITLNNDINVEVRMDISQWFKNPNTWDLNVLNTNLMSNSAAQIMMFENGQNVFSLGSVSQ